MPFIVIEQPRYFWSCDGEKEQEKALSSQHRLSFPSVIIVRCRAAAYVFFARCVAIFFIFWPLCRDRVYRHGQKGAPEVA